LAKSAHRFLRVTCH